MEVTNASWMWVILVIYLEKILDGDEGGQVFIKLSRGRMKSSLLEMFNAQLDYALRNLI